jgi:hypothetical protein
VSKKRRVVAEQDFGMPYVGKPSEETQLALREPDCRKFGSWRQKAINFLDFRVFINEQLN